MSVHNYELKRIIALNYKKNIIDTTELDRDLRVLAQSRKEEYAVDSVERSSIPKDEIIRLKFDNSKILHTPNFYCRSFCLRLKDKRRRPILISLWKNKQKD